MRVMARLVRSALTMASVLLLGLTGAAFGATAQAAPSAADHTWHLENFQRPLWLCVRYTPEEYTFGSYFLFSVTGKWTSELKFRMGDLPAGWTALDGAFSPGENVRRPDGSFRINGGLTLEGPRSVPIGTYRAYIAVTDGQVTETTPAYIDFSTDSWGDCMDRRP